MEALREASRQGITAVIATPHYYPGRYEPDAGEVLHAWRQVKQRISLEGLPVTLYPGQECFYYSGLLEQLEEGEVLTLARSLYVLVEFDPECPYLQLLQGLTELQQGGYYPVLAHFERYNGGSWQLRVWRTFSEVTVRAWTSARTGYRRPAAGWRSIFHPGFCSVPCKATYRKY